MLTLSGLKKFYFLPNFHDMRCKAPRVAEIVRNKYHRDPLPCEDDETVGIYDEIVPGLCCMDHFWAKAKKALNQGCKKAQFFVTEVGKLYRRERFYKDKGLSAERIKEMRNDSYTPDRAKEEFLILL